jgi:hypothetical protein
MDDVEKVRIHGQNRVNFTVGSALDIFGGQLDYAAIIKFLKTA